MYVIEVIPLTILPANVPQILSYYHDVELAKGAVVEVSLNNRKVTAVVIGSNILESQKILLKKSGFELKKIGKVVSVTPQVSEYQFKIALWLADKYIAPLGVCLKTVLPPFFAKKKYPILGRALLNAPAPDKLLVILSRAKDMFKKLESQLVNKGQILIIVPEVSYIEFFKEKLGEPVTIFSSGLGNQEFYDIWNNVQNGTIRIILGTRAALFLPFAKLAQLVVIDPLHEFYKSDSLPKYSAPALAETIARIHSARYISVSNLLGVQGYHKKAENEIEVRDAMAPWSSAVEIVDLVAEMKQNYFGIFSPSTKAKLIAAINDSKKILIVAARRGYNGVLVCEHCGFSFKCPRCDIPMRVHQGVELVMTCHRCATTLPYPKFCSNCHSSQLKATGPAGSQKIFQELQKMMEFGQLPRTTTLILDTDVTQNQTEEDEIMNTVKSKNPVVLIATQKVFSYVYDLNFDYIIVPNFDSLSSGNDFRSSEQLWYQMEKLADFNPETINIQTYNQKDIVPILASHRYLPLFEKELEARLMFKYPPFSRLVKLTFSHSLGRTAATEGRGLVEKLKMATAHLNIRQHVIVGETSPAFLSKEKDRFTYTVLIKVLPTLPSLREFLRFVPSRWHIDVDPRSTT